MPLRINCINDNEKGLTLIEVIVALAITAILTTVFMGVFSNSGRWIAGAGAQTKASSYATSIIEVIRNDENSIGEITEDDLTDEDDGVKCLKFKLSETDKDPFSPSLQSQVDNPSNMEASVTIFNHEDTSYYDADSDGNIDSDFENLYPKRCLLKIVVTVQWSEYGEDKVSVLSTVVGGK